MQKVRNKISANSDKLWQLKKLREKRAELDQVYKDLYSESENLVEQIEYREITAPEVIEELGETLIDLGSDDFSFQELFHRLSLYLYYNREDLDEHLRTGYGTVYKPSYRLNDTRNVEVQFGFFNQAFSFIRTEQENARENVKNQRDSIREYCTENNIPIRAEQAFIGPEKCSGDLMDYALTEMIRSMSNIIVTADITSFGRNVNEVEATVRALREKGVTIHTANDGNITDFRFCSGTDKSVEDQGNVLVM